jgi:hypothetical protein
VIEQAPPHIRLAMRRISGKIRAVLDRKTREIHVDPSIHNVGRANFKRLHEVGHHTCYWQTDDAYADSDATTSPYIKNLIEQEANVAASNLLFQLEYFDILARDYEIGSSSIQDIADIIVASYHATFRRYVMRHDAVMAGVVLDISPCAVSPVGYSRNEVVISENWQEEFGAALWPKVLRTEPYSFVDEARQARTAPGVIHTEFAFPNLRNESVSLKVDLYCNQHKIFALIWRPRREILKRRRIIVPSSISA